MQRIPVKTARRVEMVDITEKIQSCLSLDKISGGLCVVFCPHTTAGLTINENADPDVKNDITKTLHALVPESADYSHSEGNSDSHIKSSLLGSSLSIIVSEGKLQLGTWQGIFFCESDGPRQREVWVKTVKG